MKGPRDVVPGSGLTREDILAMDEAIGTRVNVQTPGEVLCDVDGIPTAVEPTRHRTASLAGVVLTSRDLQRVGLTPEDVPNISVVTPDDPPRAPRRIY